MALCLLVLLLAACASPTDVQGSQADVQRSQADANSLLLRRAFQAFEDGDLATLNELFDPQGPWHTPAGTTIGQGGPHAELEASCPFCAALEHRRITIDVMLANGDLVAVRSTWRGQCTGTFRGIAVSGKDVSVVYTNIYRVSDGRIRENWADADRLSLADQFGIKLVPEPVSR